MDITDRIHAETSYSREHQERMDERVLFGHELHDGILQSLYAVGLSLEVTRLHSPKEPNKISVILAWNIEELNKVIREVRTFVEGLDPASHPEASIRPLDLGSSLFILTSTLAQLYGKQVLVSASHAVESGMSHQRRSRCSR